MKLSQQMTLLGLVALTYYAVLLAAGIVSTAVMPQFLASAIIFLSSGRLIRKGARNHSRKDTAKESQKTSQTEPNWALRTQILNWVMTAVILCVLSLWVIKPIGISFLDFLTFK